MHSDVCRCVPMWPICAEIQVAVASDSGGGVGRRADSTTVDSSDVQGDISTASSSDAVQRLRMLRAYLEANGCLDYS